MRKRDIAELLSAGVIAGGVAGGGATIATHGIITSAEVINAMSDRPASESVFVKPITTLGAMTETPAGQQAFGETITGAVLTVAGVLGIAAVGINAKTPSVPSPIVSPAARNTHRRETTAVPKKVAESAWGSPLVPAKTTEVHTASDHPDFSSAAFAPDWRQQIANARAQPQPATVEPTDPAPKAAAVTAAAPKERGHSQQQQPWVSGGTLGPEVGDSEEQFRARQMQRRRMAEQQQQQQ